MNNKIKLKHLSTMKNTREFFLLRIPKEINMLFYITITFFVLSICIICFCSFDEVIKVQGIIRTKENVSMVKNVVEGQIVNNNYKPGQKIEKGDVLYRIDTTIYDSQKSILETKYIDIKNKLEGTKYLITSFESNKNLVPVSNNIYHSKFENYLNQKNELISQKTLTYLLYQEEVNNHSAVRNQKLIKQRRIEYEVAKNELESYESSFKSYIYSEEIDLQNQLIEVEQELDAFFKKYEYLSMKAPISGYVQELSSLNIGDFLLADSAVLNIIPDNQKSYRVELHVKPKDMGKISIGMKVKYRLSSFPFFEFKGAYGEIIALDPDIRSSENLGLYYIVYADIDRVVFSNSKGDAFPIKAGLETDSRIVMKKTRILTYILRKLDFLY